MGSLVTIGTRGSKLALAQTGQVISLLSKIWPDVIFETKTVKTKGDKILNSPLSMIGGKGLFTKELEEELRKGSIDIAVHSLKDLPTEIPKGFVIGAILKREDARDIIIKNPKSEILNPKKIGTSSLRRKAQLLVWNPDLEIVDIRGNLDTRIRKLEEQDLDAIVVALAGLKRLEPRKNSYKILPLRIMLPAPGQGAIAIQIRKNDRKIKKIIKAINHKPTELEVSAERAFLTALGGGCQVPIGAFAKISGSKLILEGVVCSVDGKIVIRDTMIGPKTKSAILGRKLARKLLKRGADKIL